MAGIRFEKGSKEWKMFTDFWSLCQKYWISENSDEYWNSFINDSNDFYEKYKDVKHGLFAKKLALSILDTNDEEIRKY